MSEASPHEQMSRAADSIVNVDSFQANEIPPNMGGPRSLSFEEYVREKRGWMMMVAAIFVQTAFQAGLQPPTWIPPNWYQQYRSYRSKPGVAPAPSPSPAESPAAAIILTEDQADRVWAYVFLNAITFATALTVLVSLLLVSRTSDKHTVKYVPWMFVLLAVSSSATYVLANSYDGYIMGVVRNIIVVYALLTFCYTFAWHVLDLPSYWTNLRQWVTRRFGWMRGLRLLFPQYRFRKLDEHTH